jgi:hypothetical protein
MVRAVPRLALHFLFFEVPMMFGFLFQARSKRKNGTVRRTHLLLEALEGRICPSITLSAQVLPGHQVLLTGTLQVDGTNTFGAAPTDEASPVSSSSSSVGLGTIYSSADITVTFSGAVSGSTTTDDSGDFSFLTSDASLGTVYAVGYDSGQSYSELASATIAVNAPVLSLAISGAAANSVTLSGSLSGVDVAGQTVTLGGAVSDSVVTDSNGNFSVTEDLSASGTIQVSTTDLWGQPSNTESVAVQTVSTGSSPQLALDVLVLPGQQVQLAGVVTGSNAAGANVTFSGAAAGSATADANGFYSFTTSSASLGAVNAVGVDSAQQSTNAATAQIAVAAPALTLNVVSSTANTVTFAGNLSDIDAAGETITISGASVGSVVTDANGNFTFTTSAANLSTVSVSATDFWGDTSNTAEVDLSDGAPVITNFAAIQIYGTNYEFKGDVLGTNMFGQPVNFGGLTSLNGQTTTIATDGSFTLNQALQAGETGTATAQTVSPSGQQSNEALTNVS